MDTQPTRVEAAAARLVRAARDGALDELFERTGVLAAFLHGSAAHPGNHAPGDLDVAVWCGGGGPTDLMELVAALTSFLGLDEVDVSVLDDAGAVLRADAVCGVALYEAERGGVTELRSRFVTERWDTAWLRRLQLEVMANR